MSSDRVTTVLINTNKPADVDNLRIMGTYLLHFRILIVYLAILHMKLRKIGKILVTMRPRIMIRFIIFSPVFALVQ